MKIAIYGNLHQEQHAGSLAHIFGTLHRNNVWTGIERHFFEYLSALIPGLEADKVIESNDFDADFIMSIGGDGTFLRTAGRTGRKQIPIVGINTGHLGYLSEVSADDFDFLFAELSKGEYKVEQRTLLEISTDAGVALPNRFALNEVAIQKNASASMLRMETEVNGNRLGTYLGDGLIVTTPTGSTAYNLSVGGPILHPVSGCFAISPIAAHSLTMRPLVISDSSTIEITTVSGRSQTFRVAIDGYSVSFPIGSRITLKKAGHTVRLLQRNGHNFACALRNKLMWGADSR